MKCSREFKAVHHSGTRSMSEVRWIILHDEEAATARGAAAWFANPRSAGSAHVCVDDHECYRTLADNQIPWAAPGANTSGLHIEQAGFASWSKIQWLKRLKTLHRAATCAARWSLAYNIPLEMLSPSELKMGRRGVAGHVHCTAAFGGSHTDPGPNYPYGRFIRMAKRRRKAIRIARALRRKR